MNTDLAMRSEGALGPAAGQMSIATTRQSQEVQAAMIVAKTYPREETAAIAALRRACRRKGLAECAMYSYPKGGTKVTGPSIRLAEAMAQAWGNIDYGVIELEKKVGESVVMAYAWDLESNTRRQMVFTVSHMLHTKQGQRLLTDPRDIYEMVANQGARRVRACLLGVIPGDIQDLAVDECEKTLAGDGTTPLADRIRNMVLAFSDVGVTKEMLEARLTYPVESCNAQDIVSLTKIFTSLRDGISHVTDWFATEKKLENNPSSEKPSSRAAAATKKMKADVKPEPEAAEGLSPFDMHLRAIGAAKNATQLSVAYTAACEELDGTLSDEQVDVLNAARDEREFELQKG